MAYYLLLATVTHYIYHRPTSAGGTRQFSMVLMALSAVKYELD